MILSDLRDGTTGEFPEEKSEFSFSFLFSHIYILRDVSMALVVNICAKFLTVTNMCRTVFYGEYKCFGPGANRQGREQWSYNLTAKQAKPFMTVDWIDGKDWLPKGRQ